MSDILIKALGFNKQVRLYGVSCVDVLNIIGDKAGYLPSSLDAVGRVLSMGAMMGGTLKGDETVTLRIDGDGPIGRIIVDADAKGHLRGYATNPQVHFENSDGTLNVQKTIGSKGDINVIKDLKLKEPFIGYTPIISGKVAEDFAYYYSVSEQIPTAISLGVLIGDDSRAIHCGGFMVQLLPNTPEEVVLELEEKIKALPNMSELLQSNYSILDILKIISKDLEVLDEIPLEFRCNCSKEKFARGILSLGSKEIKEMIDNDHEENCVCNFCLTEYHFTEDDLIKLYNEALNNKK